MFSSTLEAQLITDGKSGLKVFSGQMMPGTHYPMFPGGQFQGTVEEIRSLIQKQKRARGQLFTTVAGARLSFQVPVSGTARVFLGFRLFTGDAGDRLTLQINNEVVVNNVQAFNFNPAFKNSVTEYYPMPRPLSGQDQILFFIDSAFAIEGQAEIFYL